MMQGRAIAFPVLALGCVALVGKGLKIALALPVTVVLALRRGLPVHD